MGHLFLSLKVEARTTRFELAISTVTGWRVNQITLRPQKLPDRDLNPNSKFQRLVCYRYTIGQ